MISGLRTVILVFFIFFLQITKQAFGYIPHPDHVVVVVLENHAINQIVGNPAAPYLNSLVSDNKAALFTQSFALSHPSQGNYIQLFSGSNQGVTNDNVPSVFPFTAPNLGAELLAASKTFIGYSEDLPSVGYNGASSGDYARKHNPWVNWQGTSTNGIPDSCNQPFTSFPSNYNLLPSLSFVVANQENDMHNGSDPTKISIGDSWIQTKLDGLIQWAKTHNSLVIITFDEDDNSSANNIFTLFIGEMVQHGTYSNHIDHYNVLHLMEDMFYLPHAGASSTATTIDYCWIACAQAATITPPGPISLCQGTSVTLNSSAGLSYLWSNGATTQSINVTTPGNYSVVVSGGAGCTGSSANVAITTSAFSPNAVIFTETMGSVSGTTPISTHESANGFDNDNFTFSGTADVRSTTVSTGYPGASGGANIFITDIPGRSMTISDINTTGLANLQISFGIFKSRIISSGADLLVRVSSDGINYTTISFPPLPTGSGSAVWNYRTTTGAIPATSNLRIQFLQTDTVTQYRIDDVSLKYTVTTTSISAGGPTNFCQGGSVTLTSSFANSYLWSNGATTQSIMAVTSGNYYVIGSLLSGCSIFSNTIPVNVDTNLTPIIGISSNLGSTICAGADVLFTATSHYGGISPAYQWKKNGINVGVNNNFYSDNSLLDNDIISCVLTSNSTCNLPTTITSNSITISINLNVTPAVSVGVTPGNTICAGVNATFTATPFNGGSSPSYQWKRNGINIGANSSTYSSNSLSNNDVISCVMTSNAACPSPATASSNNLTMHINPVALTSVSVSPNTGNSICSGTSVLFTATPVNGGSSPIYQWRRNGVVVGSNLSTYSNSSLANNDTITCLMTSNVSCASPVTSTGNNVIMQVITVVAPAVTITANTGASICPGTNVTYTAVAVNGGASPTYQWKKNGTVVGINSNSYSDNTLANNDVITCVMTSNAGCTSPTIVTSNSISMLVSTHPPTSISISANTGNTVCNGTNVTFTATQLNGGTTPTFQWYINGHVTGSNSITYSSNALENGDQISCTMTGNSTCGLLSPVTSNLITMTINATVVPSVSITSNTPTTICQGTNVVFTAIPVGGGVAPSYQWKRNGTNVGTNSNTFNTNGLSNNDVISCVITSNANCASPQTATSGNITMTVTSNPVPSISISANTGNIICPGMNVTFNAIPVNGGVSPVYQWKKNGTNIGINNNSYSDNTLVQNDVISCVLTSNATCVSPAIVTSNNITITIDQNVQSAVSIVANPGSNICEGASVTFTALPVNGGTGPIYQWKKNGTIVGTNSNTYFDSNLINGNTISCTMTSNSTCGSVNVVTSNTINIIADAPVVPDVTISANPGNVICPGTNIVFTATPINGGSSPAYQWKKNGTVVGINNSTYTDNGLINGDAISCVMTSNNACVFPPTDNSNTITITVNPNVTPSVTVTPNPSGPICTGTNVIFTASPVNGGTTPVYQWKRNGIIVGTNTSTYSNSSLLNNDNITCTITSNAICASPSGATSTAIVMNVNSYVTPSVSISSNPSTVICAGTNVVFTANPVNGGGAPFYQWKKNGTNVGINSSSYSDNLLSNNDAISCQMTSSVNCFTLNPATSNTINASVINLPPSISNFTPSSDVAGANVTINGTNFNGITSVKFNGSVASYTVNNTTQITAVVPANATSGNIQVSNICGTATSANVFTVVPTASVLSLKLFIEGYYLGGGQMRSVVGLGMCDTVYVELHGSSSPYNTVYTVKGVIDVSGNGNFVFPIAAIGNSYYIVVYNHNTLKTWSASAVPFAANTSYNFSNPASKAYGNNMKNLNDGNFAIYSGDVIQDGQINIDDYNSIVNDCLIFRTGYLKEDLTGDRLIESGDFSLIENNNSFRVVMRP